jgi:predicted negative regulator of RcsB-dependent stress response
LGVEREGMGELGSGPADEGCGRGYRRAARGHKREARTRRERQTLHAWYGFLAELQSAAGAVDDALASIKQGLELAERTGGHRMDACLHRLRGDILAKRDPAAAETAYSLRIAREQGARTFELQAALSLSKLYQSMPRSNFVGPC